MLKTGGLCTNQICLSWSPLGLVFGHSDQVAALIIRGGHTTRDNTQYVM